MKIRVKYTCTGFLTIKMPDCGEDVLGKVREKLFDLTDKQVLKGLKDNDVRDTFTVEEVEAAYKVDHDDEDFELLWPRTEEHGKCFFK